MSSRKPTRPHRRHTQRRTNSETLAVFADLLRATPGQWLPIPTKTTHPSNLVNVQRRGMNPHLPTSEFDTRVENHVAVARYNPRKDTPHG
ncbi:hypothetical protein [Corynebacterium sp. TAE3-ERU16]|uniref:hypothetical protein n=1 Tax=Corynebacterium sp. TAE3-ERU16 TaxID=2849493 RepID=UPI001C471C69|nr:hypothetical protein [Corynebacterium sp. TAE3-ERU16]MBV7292353.1 hypothetical protein [Corynebacterium sp. TAE3-ERU16]